MSVFHIAWRELASILNTAVGWLVLAGFLVVAGFFWSSMVSFYVTQSTDLLTNPYAGAQMNLSDHLLAPYFGNVAVVLLMICPAISMRLFSEEVRQRTMELLLTAPVSTASIVAGKLLGALAFVVLMLASTLHLPLTLMVWGSPDVGVLIGGYASLLLVAATILAMGMMFSAMTANQVVAVVLTFGSALVLWVLGWAASGDGALAEVLTGLGLLDHVQGFLTGAVKLSDLVYFAAMIGFFSLATHQRVEGYRWR